MVDEPMMSAGHSLTVQESAQKFKSRLKISLKMARISGVHLPSMAKASPVSLNNLMRNPIALGLGGPMSVRALIVDAARTHLHQAE
jgi:hypothetical protein